LALPIFCSPIRKHLPAALSAKHHHSSEFAPESIFSTFFSLGQTIETFRGKGIYQAAVDIAIQKVNLGSWVR
jgi:monolysocardiolipin acyltransferase